jgi:hypothetical protein
MTFELQKQSEKAIQALHKIPSLSPKSPKERAPQVDAPSEALFGEPIWLSEAEISSNEKSC